MWKTIAYVAVGSVIGGVSRFLLQQFIQRRVESVFPYGTLVVNLLGCFVIGIVVGLADILSPQSRIFGQRAFVAVSPPFPRLSMKIIACCKILNTFTYISVSVVVGLMATALGILLIKNL